MNTVCIQCKFYEYSVHTKFYVSFMNTVCIQCKFYEYNVHTSQVLWIQCAQYNVKFYEYSVHTM